MARQSFVWTCLPNGLDADGGRVRLSVLLSPRLDPAGDAPALKSFPEWLDWPAALAGAEFTFFADGLPAARSAIGDAGHDPSTDTPDSTVWTALFPPGLPVRAYRLKSEIFDSEICSYSTAEVHDLVRDLYVDLAERSGHALPRIGADLLDNPRWRDLVEAVAEVDRWGTPRATGNLPRGEGATQAERRFATLGTLAKMTTYGGAGSGVLATAVHLARFELFHTPPLRPVPIKPVARRDDPRIAVASAAYERPPVPTEAELADTFDFHRAVAAMNGYPTLQRRLGLVVDFLLDRRDFPANADFDLRVEVRFAQLPTPRGGDDLTPVTKARHDDWSFAARSRVAPGSADEMRVEAGLLDQYSQPGAFAVLQADVDGAGLKLMNFARSLRTHQEIAQSDPAHLDEDVSRKEKRAGAPALRTAGLMLVRKNRAASLKARMDQNLMQAAGAAAPAPAVALWGEDLVRGYRLDVWDAATGVWRSLCRRLAEYRVDQGAILVTPKAGEEEATVQLAATRSPDPTYNANILSLHEALVAWTGWSLGAQPPGRGVGDDINTGPDGKPRFTDGAEPVAGLDLQSRFRAVPGSLPRLRYGRRYALRARAVDLAGNSLPPVEGDFGPEAPAATAGPFLRYEPLLAPVLALVRPEGGATPPLSEGESMYRMVIRSFNDVFDDPTASAETSRRAALPPRTTVREAEMHGALDRAGAVDANTFHMLGVEKDRDASDPGAAVVEERIPRQGPLDPAAVDTSYAVWRAGQALTWLPDPMAVSVSARFLGHPTISESESIAIDLYPDEAAWPEARPFVIELAEPETPGEKPAFDAEGSVLRVPLGKGERATLRLAMRIGKHDLFERMGVWEWLGQPLQDDLAEDTLEGRTWLVTPWQDVELVHAVQRPLVLPRIDRLTVGRGAGETAARPRFIARCSLKSTDRLDLLARWHEPRDPAGITGPVDESRNDLAFHVKITDGEDYVPGPGGYADHSLPTDEGMGPDVIGINQARRDEIAFKDHEFNDTRYRRIEYRLKATTRYREYFPRALLVAPGTGDGDGPPVETQISLEGPETIGWIPSSAPPPAPQALYIVPTFGWVRSRDADGTARSWRRGGGLRVYLDRPWNATGYGEMLAVVLPPPGYTGDPETGPDARIYRETVTQWGNDPIWESTYVAGVAPAPGRFPLARRQPDPAGSWLPPGAPAAEADQPPGEFETRLRLPGSNAPVEIAPHDVSYDDARQLWFADIEIDAGSSYWPFVRLALARYQPCSIGGAHLSEVVLADFMQLAADRSLVVQPEREGRVRYVTVFGSGYTASGGSREVRPRSEFNPLTGQVTEITAVSATSVLEVWLEELEPALGPDFGWRRVSDGVRSGEAPAHPPIVAGITPERLLRGRQLIASRQFARALSEGLTIDHLWLRPPLWDGRVTLPAAQAPLRLVVAEYEEYPVDGAPDSYSTTRTGTGRRLVFVEHVPID